LSSLIPKLYYYVRRELAYREAIADFAPGTVSADDIVDAVVMRAYRDAATDDADEEIDSCLMRLARRHIDAAATQVRAGHPPIQVLYFFEPPDAESSDDAATDSSIATTGHMSQTDDLCHQLGDALRGMPAVWRRVLLLRQVHGISGVALARAVDRPERHLAAILDHAQAFLRERLLEVRLPSRSRAPDHVNGPRGHG
jgi:DNA-directed RNA polymerase specialized sigma24 family protein